MILNNDLFGNIGCFILSGVKGLWSWNGRAGSVFFTGSFDFVPPPPAGAIQTDAQNNGTPVPSPIDFSEVIDHSLISVIE